MIKINLIRNLGISASSASAPDPSGRAESTMAAMKLFIMFLFPCALAMYEYKELDARRELLAEKNKELAAVEAEQAQFAPDVQQKVDEFDREKKRLEAAFQKIATVAQTRLREVKTIVTVQRVLPQGVWLSNLNINGESVEISGFATNDDSMYEFIGALEKSSLFTAIEPKGSSQAQTPIGTAKKFELAFRVGVASEGP